jgi:hypothetical protein
MGAGLGAGALMASLVKFAASVLTRTIGGGGTFGICTISFGASTFSKGKISGCSKGIATSSPAIANCTVAEPSAVQRCVPDTGKPRDSTKLPSNIRHLHRSDRCASARNASVICLDTYVF